MTQLAAVAEALDFVERHLKQEIGVADMAHAAGYSLYHFCRVFNGLVHHTPYDYLMRRRLSQSAELLLESDWNVVDVAFEYQFNSHETYSRAFKRMFGLPPSRYRALQDEEGRAPDRRAWMPPLTVDYLRHINQNLDLTPDLLERDALPLVGLMSRIRDGAAVDVLWCTLGGMIGGADELRAHYGVAWQPDDGGGCFYLAAVAVPDAAAAGPLHPALVTKSIPPHAYARFVHRGSREELELTRGYIYHTWLPQSDRRLACPLEIECHGRRTPDGEERRWELLIPIE